MPKNDGLLNDRFSSLKKRFEKYEENGPSDTTGRKKVWNKKAELGPASLLYTEKNILEAIELYGGVPENLQLLLPKDCALFDGKRNWKILYNAFYSSVKHIDENDNADDSVYKTLKDFAWAHNFPYRGEARPSDWTYKPVI